MESFHPNPWEKSRNRPALTQMLKIPPTRNQNRREKKDFENFNGMVLYREKRAARKRSLTAPLTCP
jgi:hypothetical protein